MDVPASYQHGLRLSFILYVSDPPTPVIDPATDDLMRPGSESLESLGMRQVQPVLVTQVGPTAEVIAGHGYDADTDFAEDRQGAWHVAGAGDEQKIFEAALLHQSSGFDRFIMSVTTDSEAV